MQIIKNLMILFALYFLLSFNSGCGVDNQHPISPGSTQFNNLEIALNGESVNNLSIRPANGQTITLGLLLVPDITLNHENAVINVVFV
jgi:hypothetical protein